MFRYTAQRDIRRPAQDVFAYLTDVGRQTEWVHGVSECHWVTPGAPAVGSTAEQSLVFMGKTHVAPMRVVDYQPGRRIVFEKQQPFFIRYGFELEPDGATTHVRYPVEMSPTGFLRVVIALAGRRFINGDLQRIAGQLEAAG
jgi:uncharacterized protein YndB with AHSA1/START domain